MYFIVTKPMHVFFHILINFMYPYIFKNYRFSMVAYFSHHLSENYVDLSDLFVVLSVNYVDLSDLFVVLSVIYVDLSDHCPIIVSTCQKYIITTNS